MSNKKLDKIRAGIPNFACKEGCHDCCGPVNFSKEELSRIEKRPFLNFDSLKCQYVGKNGCEIYEERPIMCRLFGAVEDLRCPHGCGPKVLMKAEEAREILSAVYGD